MSEDRVRECMRVFGLAFGSWREEVNPDCLDDSSDFGLTILEQVAGSVADGFRRMERALGGKKINPIEFALYAPDGDEACFHAYNQAWRNLLLQESATESMHT